MPTVVERVRERLGIEKPPERQSQVERPVLEELRKRLRGEQGQVLKKVRERWGGQAEGPVAKRLRERFGKQEGPVVTEVPPGIPPEVKKPPVLIYSTAGQVVVVPTAVPILTY